MLPIRRLSPMPMLVLLAGTSAVAFAAPQQRGRHEPPPQVRQHAPQARAPAPAPAAMPAPRPERQPPQARHRSNEDALSDSIRRIERNTRGQVLSAERVPYDGRSVNRIKVVDDRGRVRIYMDDPQRPAVAETPTRGDDD